MSNQGKTDRPFTGPFEERFSKALKHLQDIGVEPSIRRMQDLCGGKTQEVSRKLREWRQTRAKAVAAEPVPEEFIDALKRLLSEARQEGARAGEQRAVQADSHSMELEGVVDALESKLAEERAANDKLRVGVQATHELHAHEVRQHAETRQQAAELQARLREAELRASKLQGELEGSLRVIDAKDQENARLVQHNEQLRAAGSAPARGEDRGAST